MKIIITYLFLLVSFYSVAQIVAVEKPKIPTPEKEVLFFLQENHLFNLDNYKGKIASVFKTKTGYKKDKSIITFDTITFFDKSNNIKKINKFTFIDKIGIDSVVKRKNKSFSLFKKDADADYMWQEFTAKNNKITEYADNGAVEYLKEKYSYNSKNKLIRIGYSRDYSNYVVKLTYNKQGKLQNYKMVNNSDGTQVEIIKYNYKNNLLIGVQKMAAHYFFNQTDIDIPVEDIKNYDKYEEDDTFKNVENIRFYYNDKNQLIKAVKHHKKFSEVEGIRFEQTQQFTLTYKPNKLIVNATLPEKKQYVYTFDAQQNPIEINCFSFKNDVKILEEQTQLKITYHENH